MSQYDSRAHRILSVFLAYAVVTHEKSVLFIDSHQLDEDVRQHLGPSVEVQPYESVLEYLRHLSNSLNLSKEKVRTRSFTLQH